MNRLGELVSRVGLPPEVIASGIDRLALVPQAAGVVIRGAVEPVAVLDRPPSRGVPLGATIEDPMVVVDFASST